MAKATKRARGPVKAALTPVEQYLRQNPIAQAWPACSMRMRLQDCHLMLQAAGIIPPLAVTLIDISLERAGLHHG